MSQWPYPYCPHQAFNNNMQIRLASIPCSIIPDPTIDAFTNVNIKCANLNKRNIESLAYEQYFCSPQSDLDTNFARDYYLQSKPTDQIKFDNNVVEEKKLQLEKASAYVLATQAIKQYQKFQQNRKNVLDSARRRAVSAWKTHQIQKKDDKTQSNGENGEWLKKLYRKLQQIAKHIVQGDGQSLQQKQRMFLLSKGSLTANYLSQIKVKNPKTAFQILQQLRTLMLKKKLKFQNQREQQQKNKSVSMSYTSQATQNTSQGSMLSQATSVNESNIDGEQQLLAKFCDFQNLSRKWGMSDVSQVKYMLRLMLTRKYVSEAEVQAIKKKKQAERMNLQLEKLNPEMAKKRKAQKEARQSKPKQEWGKPKRAQSTKQVKKSQNILQQKVDKSLALNKQDQAIKDKLLSGGQFDATGQKYSRNRNFSQLFSKRQQQITISFAVKQQKDSGKATPNKSSNFQTKVATPIQTR